MRILDILFMLLVTGAASLVLIYVSGIWLRPRREAPYPGAPQKPGIVRDFIECEGANKLGVEYYRRKDGKGTFMVRLMAERNMMTVPLDDFWRQLTDLMDRAASREPGRVVQTYDCDDCRAEFRYASISSGKEPRFCPECGMDSATPEETETAESAAV